MSPGVLAFVLIGMVMIIGIPAGIVIRRVIRTERARRKSGAAGQAGAVGTYYVDGGSCSGSIDCSGGIASGCFGDGF